MDKLLTANQDIYDCFKKLYAREGTELKMIEDHGHFIIAEDPTGNRFTVNKKKLIEKPAPEQPMPEKPLPEAQRDEPTKPQKSLPKRPGRKAPIINQQNLFK